MHSRSAHHKAEIPKNSKQKLRTTFLGGPCPSFSWDWYASNGILLTILPFSSFQSRVTYTLIFLAILDSICNRNGNCWVSLQIVYHCMCYKAKIRFFCQVMNTQGSLCFSISHSFLSPGFPACNFGLQMKNLSACGRHQGLHPPCEKKTLWYPG